MRKRRLGNSDLEITTIGFGTFATGGAGWKFAWGAQDDEQSIRAMHAALDGGVNWIDTAAVYGLGHAEEVVRRAISTAAQKPYVFTKCGLPWDSSGEFAGNLSEASIRKEVEGSLTRLGVETIDLYQIHWPRPPERVAEGWDTLSKLKQEGKVRHIGVSNFTLEQLQTCAAIAPITSLQPPYSMLERSVEAEIFPYVQAHNIGVIAYAPLQSGLLSGRMTKARVASLPADDWRKQAAPFQEPALSHNLAVAAELGLIAEELGCHVPEVAIAWVLANPAVTGAIVGARAPEQVAQLLGADDVRLTPELMTRIQRCLG